MEVRSMSLTAYEAYVFLCKLFPSLFSGVVILVFVIPHILLHLRFQQVPQSSLTPLYLTGKIFWD